MKKLFIEILIVCLMVGIVEVVNASDKGEKPSKSIESYTYPAVVIRNTNVREGKGIKYEKVGMLYKGAIVNLTFERPFDPYNDEELWLNTCILIGWLDCSYIKPKVGEYKTMHEKPSLNFCHNTTIGKILKYTGKKEGIFLQVQYTEYIPDRRISCGYIYKRNLMFFKTENEAHKYSNKMKNQERIRKKKITKEKRQKKIKKQNYELSLAKRDGCILYLKKWSWYNEQNYVYAKGEVQNISGKRLGLIKVLVTWFDKNGTYINHDYSYLTLNVLMPNQSSPFKIIERHNPLMVKANIKFLINNVEIKTYQK